MAICPSTASGDNELQMAGKTNESINGSQHEKGFRGSLTQWRRNLLWLTACSRRGDVKVLQSGKDGGWKRMKGEVVASVLVLTASE